MYTYIHTCAYIHIYIYIHTHAYIHIQTCISTNLIKLPLLEGADLYGIVSCYLYYSMLYYDI